MAPSSRSRRPPAHRTSRPAEAVRAVELLSLLQEAALQDDPDDERGGAGIPIRHAWRSLKARDSARGRSGSRGLWRRAADLGALAVAYASVPTPHEDRGWYYVMRQHSEAIRRAARRDGRPLERTPLFGSIPFSAFQHNAVTYAVPDSDEHVVVFDRHLFVLAHLFSRAVSQCLTDLGPTDAGARSLERGRDRIRHRIANEPALVVRFVDLLLSTHLLGGPARARPYRAEGGTGMFAEHLTVAIETFALAHEYGHVQLGHLTGQAPSDGAAEPVTWSWRLERDADDAGLRLCALALFEEPARRSFALAGAVGFFACMDVIERAKPLIFAGPPPHGPASHPPTRERLDRARKVFARDIAPGLPARDVAEMAATADLVQGIAEDLLSAGAGALRAFGRESAKRLSARPPPSPLEYVNGVVDLRDAMLRRFTTAAGPGD